MKIISASKARANLFSLLQQVNEDHRPTIITSKKGDAVLVSKEDWESLQETLYLTSIPNMTESIKEGGKTPLTECIAESNIRDILNG